MPPTTIDTTHSSSIRAGGVDRLVRDVLFLATFLLICLTATPFPDLSDPKLLEPAGDGNRTGQVLMVLLTMALAAFLYVKDARIFLKAFTPILVIIFLWFALSAAFSPHGDLAARRLVLAAFTIFQATAFLLLPQDRDHFSRLLAVGALTGLALCYLGVIFLPEHSIHQASDLAEPELAGNWRGFFTHKNGAGAAMAVLVFIGIFAARTLSAPIGLLIIALATGFLIVTESKSPLSLLLPVLIASLVLVRLRNPLLKWIAAAGLPLIIAVMTIGSVTLEPIRALVYQLMSDPSFTGRDEIWVFTIDHILQRPVVGWGFQAFWGTPELVSAWTYLESWGYRASDAHNGFLNIAVMTGLVGLVLSLIWVFVQPLTDLIRTPPERCDPALTLLLVQVWLFGLCVCGFESELFNGGSIVWFMSVAAIIGLRFQATAQLTRVSS
jgi:O-antigen ligase